MGPVLGDAILLEVSGSKVPDTSLGFLNENILVITIVLCSFWLCKGPVVATFYLTTYYFLATDRWIWGRVRGGSQRSGR